MTKHTVESKYVNPDRYIALLKDRHERQVYSLEKSLKYWKNRKGNVFLSYSSGATYSLSADCSLLTNVRVDSKIVIEATVKSIQGNRGSSSIEYDKIMVSEAKS